MSFDAYEFVKNISDRPIPEHINFSIQERRKLSDCQRRAHLNDYDPVLKRDPLTDSERVWMEEMVEKQRQTRIIQYAGLELRFAPGQIYQVPRGHADRIVALNPAKLVRLTWADVRHVDQAIPEIHIQTEEEALNIAVTVGSGGDDGLRTATPVVEIKDNLVRYGEGAWQPIVRG